MSYEDDHDFNDDVDCHCICVNKFDDASNVVITIAMMVEPVLKIMMMILFNDDTGP